MLQLVKEATSIVSVCGRGHQGKRLILNENYTSTCSVAYWVLNLLQVPTSKGDEGTNFRVLQLVSYYLFGVVGGVVGGLLGLGGGFIMGPLFLEVGVPHQVLSATATFVMTFCSSMSVVAYYLLKRFLVRWRSQEVVELSGAYTLGSKGFGNPTVFDNSYYKILLEKSWLSSGGMSSMVGLPSNRNLVEDDEWLRWIKQYAEDQEMFFEDFKNAYIKLVNSGARWKKS
ncbi:hypothetical protein ACFE04_023135 [Oxalis oulophora]